MTQKSPNQIVFEKAYQWASKELEKIDVISKDYDGGNKCQQVAFNQAFVNPNANIVVSLMFIPKSGVRIHFINKLNDEYHDHTLGYLTTYNRHFKLAEFKWNELKDYQHPAGASNMLIEFKESVLNLLFTPEGQEKLGISTENI